ncbi:Osmoprotectant-binding protein OsmX [Austwickia sp. TVS 96-490-7B]|uniref:ABC transporter substrate-binding protein n=1 Tax=Austwickia sp. TVS 96-490-7B TaxID=2830843 RepID=UPI001C57E675|nr:ABC transporter substrate-binding protein [Austwickia sp. TVS 96-490-7B]MBW3085137.1 Osmoprotectant-binding protein OsmX [Austwickia sp. TVS 96-490-7B]
MSMRRGRTPAVLILIITLTGCGSPTNNPLATGAAAPTGQGAPPARSGQILVGSADFTESALLAEIYVGALKAKGVDAAPKLRIGSREAYLKGMQDGSVQVVPEYTGALSFFYRKDAAETDPDRVLDGLRAALPPNLTVLDRSAAEDKDSITVTRETARTRGLRTVSDLTAVADHMVLGAPDEFKARPQGLPGLAGVYGIVFSRVRTPLTGQAVVQALKHGQIDAANIFTTDPAISAHDFVVLDDDKHLFGTQHIVPLVAKDAANPTVTAALNGVSAALNTEDLRVMLGKVDIDKQDPQSVARQWLQDHHLLGA